MWTPSWQKPVSCRASVRDQLRQSGDILDSPAHHRFLQVILAIGHLLHEVFDTSADIIFSTFLFHIPHRSVFVNSC